MSLAKKIAVAVKTAIIAGDYDATVYVNNELNDVWVTTHPVWSDPATRNDWRSLGTAEGYYLDGYTDEELEAFDVDDAPEHWTAWALEDLEKLEDFDD
jgi:hypothetical protein